jgi:hypothetical protein
MHRIKEGERVRPGSREKFCAVTIMLKYRATPSITNLENSPKPLGWLLLEVLIRNCVVEAANWGIPRAIQQRIKGTDQGQA